MSLMNSLFQPRFELSASNSHLQTSEHKDLPQAQHTKPQYGQINVKKLQFMDTIIDDKSKTTKIIKRQC